MRSISKLKHGCLPNQPPAGVSKLSAPGARSATRPCEDWAFNTGGGFDDPTNSDLNDGNKSLNYFVFTNANYAFSKYLSTGLELTYWRTDYKNSNDGDDFRVQHSWILKF
ncbi:MAG: hypothetical protein KAT56_00320 [Sedimentisphaerales bacterium]|nr:hypothetical protein [Sedimentisphaerales bacterium]